MIKQRLFTPGPTDVPPEVLDEMSKPMFHHRTGRFRKMFAQVNVGLKKIMRTENDVLTLAGSGTAGMEAAIACTVPRDKKVLIANGGKFGERWVKVALRYGLDVDEVKVDWGTAIEAELVREKLSTGNYGAVIVVYSETSTATACDLEAIGKVVAETDAILLADCITAAGSLTLETDKWNIDVAASGSQKAFMLPPGLAFLSVSEKAWKNAEKISPPCFYLDLNAYRKSIKSDDTPYTPAVSLIRGAKVALDMINEIGIESVWYRTSILAEAFREAMKALGMEIFSKSPSDSVTGVLYGEGIDDGVFRGELLRDKYGCSVAGGQDDLKGKLFRVSHMGYVDILDTIGLVGAIECALSQCTGAAKTGIATAKAVEILKDWK